MEHSKPTRCLILACGNPLRGDDGAGPWLAQWAQERFRDDAGVRVIARQQWTPELAEEIACAESLLFIDSSLESAAGELRVSAVEPEIRRAGLATHHLSAGELLGLAQELFGPLRVSALLLTVGAESTGMKEGFSGAVETALPRARAEIERFVLGGAVLGNLTAPE